MRRRPFLASCVVLLTAIGVRGSAGAEPKPPPPPFVVIVHPSNSAGALDRKFVSDAFLKKVTRWPGGDVIRPVDLPPDSPVRARFSDDVLNRSVQAVKSYWQQIIFSGRDVPPPELASDADVMKYVATTPGAVGYVSGSTTLDGVRAVRIE